MRDKDELFRKTEKILHEAAAALRLDPSNSRATDPKECLRMKKMTLEEFSFAVTNANMENVFLTKGDLMRCFPVQQVGLEARIRDWMINRFGIDPRDMERN